MQQQILTLLGINMGALAAHSLARGNHVALHRHVARGTAQELKTASKPSSRGMA